MKNYYSTSIAKSLKKHELPMLRIKLLRTLCFDVLIDTSIKHNLIDPNFIYFEVKEDFYTYVEDENYIGNSTPSIGNMHLFKDFFQKLSIQEIIGKDGVKQSLDKLNFNFELKGEKYSDSFFVINLNSTSYNIPNVNIDAVLGTDFLSKHKWIIDYKKKVIYTPRNH